MVPFGLLKTFFRELTARQGQSRGPRPSNCLSAQRIIEALTGGGAADGRFASGYLFHTANISQTIAGADNCLDLGAAPGCQLLQVAGLNPEIEFIGVDTAGELNDIGEERADRLGISNVGWRSDDICTLSSFDTNSVDAVISTMTLHDLTNLEAVKACFHSINRVLKPGGAIYLEDYGRLRSAKSISYFNAVNAAIPEDAFAELNACSMHAAFEITELQQLFASCFPKATLYSTFLIPFLNVLKTESRDISAEKRHEIASMRTALPTKQRIDLDDLRKFFKLGGWKTDPFA